MTSITTQQTKLDLELVPKENRLDIGKCNGRIPHGLKPKEETFQVVLDALALAPCYPAFIITADVPEVYMHQFWNSVYKHHDFYRFKIDKKKRFKLTLEVFRDILQICPRIEDQDFDALRPEEDTVSFLIGTVPPKVSKKFKKACPSKKDSVSVPADEEPVQKGKRVKRSTKKSSITVTTCIVIREPHMETQSKRKEKVDVARGKVIDLLSKVALTEEAQMKEVRKKILRNFHKSHPSGSGSVAEKPSSVEKITPPVISEGTGDKPWVLNVTKYESTESESKTWRNDEDGSNNEERNSKSNQQDDEDDDKDDDRGMDIDDVQDEKADVGMTDAQQEKENLEITQEQVIEDAHVTITKKTEVHVTSSSSSSNLASKFLKFLDIPPADTEIVSPLDVYVHHEVPRIHTSTLLAILNDPLHTQVTALVDDHLYTRMGATREEFMNFLSASLTDRITKESLNQVNLAKASSQPQSSYEAAATLTKFELKKILIDKINSSESYLTAPEHQKYYDSLIKSYNLDKDFFSSYDVYSLKRSRDDKDKDEGPSARSDRGLKKQKTSKPTTSLKTKDSSSKSFKGTKSQPKSSGKSVHAKEPELQVGDTDTPQGQEGNQGTRSNYAELEYDFEECYKALLEKLDWENPKGGDYPFDLSKPLPLITRGNRQSIPVEFFINNDLKYLQGGILTMTYMTFTAKTKATQYDLPGNEDMVPNIWSLVKVAYDKYALWGISHWRDQRKTFYTYARGIQSRGDVYSTKRILAVTHVSIIRKHRYGYLEEIVVRRADNALYRFKKGDFLRLRINDIKDMLLLVVQNRLINLLRDDVADFAIALRMFTRSLVIQK
nr:hypothetical protein [Tanacetum cinerariifolium]